MRQTRLKMKKERQLEDILPRHRIHLILHPQEALTSSRGKYRCASYEKILHDFFYWYQFHNVLFSFLVTRSITKALKMVGIELPRPVLPQKIGQRRQTTCAPRISTPKPKLHAKAKPARRDTVESSTQTSKCINHFQYFISS